MPVAPVGGWEYIYGVVDDCTHAIEEDPGGND
jgi:hypothetical protein